MLTGQNRGHNLGRLLEEQNNSSEQEYINIIQYGNYYETQYLCYTLIMIFNLLNLLEALRIIRIVHWLMLTIERTNHVILLFMMMLIPLQVGFAFLTYVFVGPYLKKYSSMVNGFKQ